MEDHICDSFLRELIGAIENTENVAEIKSRYMEAINELRSRLYEMIANNDDETEEE